jgi:hypothetical protein
MYLEDYQVLRKLFCNDLFNKLEDQVEEEKKETPV